MLVHDKRTFGEDVHGERMGEEWYNQHFMHAKLNFLTVISFTTYLSTSISPIWHDNTSVILVFGTKTSFKMLSRAFGCFIERITGIFPVQSDLLSTVKRFRIHLYVGSPARLRQEGIKFLVVIGKARIFLLGTENLSFSEWTGFQCHLPRAQKNFNKPLFSFYLIFSFLVSYHRLSAKHSLPRKEGKKPKWIRNVYCNSSCTYWSTRRSGFNLSPEFYGDCEAVTIRISWRTLYISEK